MQHARYPEVDAGFGHWLAGFADGEGCFQIRKQPLGRAWICWFQIGLRLDDRAILDEIRQRTGLGHVSAALGTHRTRPGSQDRALWRVLAKQEVRRLVELFDAYPLRAKKRGDYLIWRQAVLYWLALEGDRRGPIALDWGPIPALATELRAGRKYDAPLILFRGGAVASDPRLFGSEPSE